MRVENRRKRRRYVPCIDCRREGITVVRPLYRGPRCKTHWQVERKRLRQVRHDAHVERTYELNPDDYQAIYDSQNGSCFVCRRAKGKRKYLAVDHEHDKPGCDHPPNVGCRECVRCLACTTCNRIVLGRYDVAALKRAIEVLEDPPARKILTWNS